MKRRRPFARSEISPRRIAPLRRRVDRNKPRTADKLEDMRTLLFAACLLACLSGCATWPGRIDTYETWAQSPAGVKTEEKTTTTTTEAAGDKPKTVVVVQTKTAEPVMAVRREAQESAVNDNPAQGPLAGGGYKTSGAQTAKRTATPYVLGGCVLIAFGVFGLFAKTWLATILPFDMPTQAPVVSIYAGAGLAAVPVLGDMLANPVNVLILVGGGVAVAYGTGLFSNAKKAAKRRQPAP